MEDFNNIMDNKDINYLVNLKRQEEKAAAISKLQEKIEFEEKLKAGAERMLLFSETCQKGETIERSKVEQIIEESNKKIEESNKKISDLMKKLEFYKNLPDHKEGYYYIFIYIFIYNKSTIFYVYSH